MQMHNLKRVTANKSRMIVGRGSKRGKTSGRGTKGQKARAGRKMRPEIRDMIKKIPKLRGRGSNFLKTRQASPHVLNLGAIDKAYEANAVVSRETLTAKGLIRGIEGEGAVKILSDGEITKALIFEGVEFSAPAKIKIEKAGGKIGLAKK